MEYTFKQISEDLWELRVESLIFLLDKNDDLHAQMISDFANSASVERFIELLTANPSEAFALYNGLE